MKQPVGLTEEELRDAFAYAIEKTRANIPTFSGGWYPAPASVGNVYPRIPNNEWTSGFWNGMLWLAYLQTKDEAFRTAAENTLADYRKRLDERIATNTHDLGFLYILSAKAQYLITGNEEAKDTVLLAADLLIERYHPKAGIIQAWGDLDDPAQRGRIIIDCLMNLPLLFWATEITGDQLYRLAALSHLDRTRETIIREDDTTFHTFYFDTKSGKPLRGTTHQGYSDGSCWARGQAWGIYGLALAYGYTGDPGCLTDAKRLANYFLDHLPEDRVCYWDLIFTQGSEERDSSAAAIAVQGLHLLASFLGGEDSDRQRYAHQADLILSSLVRGYTTRTVPESNGILLHAVYHKPNGIGVNECTVWGDYFYMEALGMKLHSAMTFW